MVSEDVSVAAYGLVISDPRYPYPLPLYGVCISNVEGVDYMVWEADSPSPEDREALKRYE